MNKDIGSLQKAKDYAFLLLKFRPRSEKEISWRLKKKKFSEETIKQTLLFLKEKDFIDDNFFARSWVESRMRRAIGPNRLKYELKIKGIAKEIIEEQIAKIKAVYPQEKIALKIAQEKISKLKAVEPLKAKRRVYQYLLRRGFSPEVVTDVLERL